MQKVKSSSRPGAAAEAEASRLACPRPRRSRCDWRSVQCDPSPRQRASVAAARPRRPPPPRARRAAFVAPARVLSRRAFPLAPCSLLQDELPSTAAAQRLAAWPDPRMAFSRAARLRGAAAARLQPRAAPAAPRARTSHPRGRAQRFPPRVCPSLPRCALAPAVRRASAPPRARRFSEELECMRFGRPSVFKVRQSRTSEYRV